MKMKRLSLIFCLLWAMGSLAQVKIGDNPESINNSSVLELESTSKVLVITRVTTAQMNAISPSAGALVYNTDLGCVHYFSGTAWVNICNAVAGSIQLTSSDKSILITETGITYDLVMGEIGEANFSPGAIHGDALGDGSVNEKKLAPNSVGEEHLQTGSVTEEQIREGAVRSEEILNGSIQPVDLQPGAADQLLSTNAAGNAVVWINRATLLDPKENTANKSNAPLGNSEILFPTQNAVKTYVDAQIGGAAQVIVSGDAGNNISTGTDGGALYIDGDTDSTNELQYLEFDQTTKILSLTQTDATENFINLSDLVGSGTGTTVEVDGITITGDGSEGTPLRIVPSEELTQQVLTSNAGTVAWESLAATGQDTLITDTNLFIGRGIVGDTLSIRPSQIPGRFLRTNMDGLVVWDSIAPGSQEPIVTDTTLFTGRGVTGDTLKIRPSQIPGRFLRTNMDGLVVWDSIAPGSQEPIVTDTILFTGRGVTGDTLTIRPSQIPGRFLRTNMEGLVVWDSLVTNPLSIIGLGTTDSPLQLAPGAIGIGQIADNTITAAKIRAEQVGTFHLAPSSITRVKLLDNVVNEDKLANNAVTAEKIVPGVITNAHIADDALIEGTKINPKFDTSIALEAGNILTFGSVNAIGPIRSNGDAVIDGFISAKRSITTEESFFSNTATIQPIPDYVFQKYYQGQSALNASYRFKSLQEVEAFIKKNHHLPGIQSHQEAKKEGKWNLSASNLQNLEKIEELFLHTIEQEKKIESLQSENQSLTRELKSIKQDLEEIKALLKK